MDFYVLLFIGISSIPAFYLAFRKDSVIIPNEKFNNYFIRLLILYPIPTSFTLLFSFAVIFGFEKFLDFLITPENIQFLKYAALSLPLIFGICIIGFFKKYLFKNEEHQKSLNALKSDFFVYFPDDKIIPRRLLGTKYNFPKRAPKNFLIGIQMSDLLIESGEIKDRDILFSVCGELIISERVLSVFQNNGLTGFWTRPVKYRDENPAKAPKDRMKYYQVLSYQMPPISEQTQIKKGRYTVTYIPLNNELYYNSKDLENVKDFNNSFEYFGANDNDPYSPQRLWIVSSRVKDIFVKEFDQKDFSFIPVYSVDSENSQTGETAEI